MPKLPKGMFRWAGRPGWYIRLYRGGRERWVSLGAEFGEACDKARALAAGPPVATTKVGTMANALGFTGLAGGRIGPQERVQATEVH